VENHHYTLLPLKRFNVISAGSALPAEQVFVEQVFGGAGEQSFEERAFGRTTLYIIFKPNPHIDGVAINALRIALRCY
jgi:hypothetical protein